MDLSPFSWKILDFQLIVDYVVFDLRKGHNLSWGEEKYK